MRFVRWGHAAIVKQDARWVLIPASDAPTKVYIAATFVLYVTAAAELFYAARVPARFVPSGTVTGTTAFVWAMGAVAVALAQAVAFVVPSYTVYRVQAIVTAAWAGAYWANLLYTTFVHHTSLAGLVLWGWVVIVHLLFTRTRLSMMLSAPLPPLQTSLMREVDGVAADRLSELADRVRRPPPHRARSARSQAPRKKPSPEERPTPPS